MKTSLLSKISLCALIFLFSCEVEQPSSCNCEKLQFPAEDTQSLGAISVALKGEKAGLPLSALPGVKTMTTQELTELKEAPPSGLYLLDTDFVPQELAEELKTAGFRLHKDGTLDSAGVKISLFVQSEVFLLRRRQQSNSEQVEESMNSRAFPLPWAAYSYSFWWRYNGGFCRDYHAHTRAYAYGPRAGDVWPRTNIALIQTNVRNDTDVCFNCFEEGSDWSWDIGCFWPAHGGASGSHYMYMYDPGITIYRTWGWSH